MKLDQETIENKAQMKDLTSKLSFLKSELSITINELSEAKKTNKEQTDKINDLILDKN